jgi:beta-glucosidase-like glycosyl hydrolase
MRVFVFSPYSSFFFQFANSALRKGLISEDDINARLRNLFRIRYRLAHFDASSPLNSVPLSVVCSGWFRGVLLFKVLMGGGGGWKDAAIELARDGVTQSTVLVKNEKKLLPIRNSNKVFAVIGPNTNLSSSVAGYYGPPNVCNNNFWTVYDAVRWTLCLFVRFDVL